MKKHLFTLVFALISVSQVLLAQRTINGMLTDETGEPLIGASVLMLDKSQIPIAYRNSI